MPKVNVEENVMVASANGFQLGVDIARPSDSDGNATGVLFLPGGGWVSADHKPLKERYGIPLAERGFVCVTAPYRIMEQAIWPAAIQDVKAILRWMRTNSGSLGIDPERIAVAGKSAGGHLALLTAATNGKVEYEGPGINSAELSRVSAAVGVAPASDIRKYWRREPLGPYTASDSSDAALTAANPAELVHGDWPPIMLLHGTSDERVDHRMSMRLFDLLEEAGVTADMRLFAGQDHMFDGIPEFSNAIVESVAFFLERYVTAPVAEAVAADD
ncbi:MAG: alpha/beta hydrolase [Chloroflexi bacterium]|nr:alpha/beta hydrolase [Chloroflexota bacterium]